MQGDLAIFFFFRSLITCILALNQNDVVTISQILGNDLESRLANKVLQDYVFNSLSLPNEYNFIMSTGNYNSIPHNPTITQKILELGFLD